MREKREMQVNSGFVAVSGNGIADSGIFGVVRNAVVLALLVLALFNFSACSKSKVTTASLEVLIRDSQGDGAYKADEAWKETIYTGDGNFTVEVDAVIDVPDVDKYPVVEWVNARFTDEDVNRVFNTLTEGFTFKPTGTIKIKADIQAEIEQKTELREDILEKGVPTGEYTEYTLMGRTEKHEMYKYDGYRIAPGYIAMQIEKLEQDVKDAPEERETEHRPVLRLEKEIYPDIDETNRYERASYTEYLDDEGEHIEYYVNNAWREENGKCQGFFDSSLYYNWRETGNYYSGRWTTADTEKVKTVKGSMTREQAVKKAQDILDLLGVEGLELGKLEEEAYYFSVEYATDGNTTTEYMGWQATANRRVEGVPVPAGSYSTSLEIDKYNAQRYGYEPNDLPKNGSIKLKGWTNEEMVFGFGDRGLTYFTWAGKCEMGDVVNGDVKLLPFKDIKRAIKDNYAAYAISRPGMDDKSAIKTSRHNVYRIALGMMQTRTPDGSKLRMLPVWDVYATVVSEFDMGKLREYYADRYDWMSDSDLDNLIDTYYDYDYFKEEDSEYSVLTINAIDGSVVFRERGY